MEGIIIKSIQYVTEGPYFWGSMGFIVAIAMLTNSIIFKSNRQQIFKFILALFTYLIMLTFVNFTRAAHSILTTFTPDQNAKAYASTVTVIIVSLFWMLGILLGYLIDKYKIRKL